MKYPKFFILAVGACLLLTSCFKDEAPNAECDILKAYIDADNIDDLFNNKTDATVEVLSSTDQITFNVKDNAVITAMAPKFELTPGATISPASGTELDFSNSARHKYTVTSEDGAWKREYFVGFSSKLLPLSFSFENFDYWKDKDGNDKYHQLYDFSRGSSTDIYRCWATGNAGFRLSNRNASADEYPSVSVEGGVKGRCVKLTTCSTGAFGVMAKKRIAAGNLFTGVFNVDSALTNTMLTTRFGLPFDKKPLRLTGYYKYAPGETYQDFYGKPVPNKVDHGDIYAVLYRNHDDNGKAFVLHGDDVKTSPYIVAIGEVGGVTDTNDEWIPFNFDFVYKENIDPGLLRANGYSLAIVCTSSYEGAAFQGAVGSTLYVDEFELICEE